MSRLWPAAALVAALSPLSAKDTYPRQAGVSPQHYIFALTLSDATDEIDGTSTITIRFTKDGLTSFFLDLSGSANGKGMTVTGVTSGAVNGPPVRFSHLENHLTIALDRPTSAGELRSFTVRYHGIPADGLRVGVNKYNERCFFSWNWPNKARDWLPMIDHPSAKATSEFIVTAPQKYSVVANGLLQGETMLGDGRKTTHWKESVPIASWLNAIGVEQFAVHHAGMVKGVELQTWVAHQELDAGIAPWINTAIGIPDPSATDTSAGFLYSYEFLATDGSFDVIDSTSSSISVPTALLQMNAQNISVSGTIKDKDGEFNQYTITFVNPLFRPISPVVQQAIDVKDFILEKNDSFMNNTFVDVIGSLGDTFSNSKGHGAFTPTFVFKHDF